MQKAKRKTATGSATVNAPTIAIPQLVLGTGNQPHKWVKAQAITAWVASVGGPANVTWQLTAAGKAAIANAPSAGQKVLPYGYKGKPNGVRPTQLNWLLYGIHPSWQTAVNSIAGHGYANIKQQQMVLASSSARHGGAYKHTPATQPVYCLQAYFSLIRLCTGVTTNPCVLVAALNGGGSPCNKKFSITPSATPKPVIKLAVKDSATAS